MYKSPGFPSHFVKIAAFPAHSRISERVSRAGHQEESDQDKKLLEKEPGKMSQMLTSHHLLKSVCSLSIFLMFYVDFSPSSACQNVWAEFPLIDS